MSDQEQAPIGETPGADDTPIVGTVAEQEQVNWEERYKHLQGDYTRATQEAAELRALKADLSSDDPEKYRRAVEALGLQYAEDETVEEYAADPYDALRKEFDEFKSSLTAKEQKAQEDAHVARVEALIDQQAQDFGLDKDTKEWVVARAFTKPFVDGVPDLKSAYTDFQAFETERMKQWAKTKRAPHVSSSGTSATQLPDLDNPKQRIAWMKERLAAEE